MSWNAVGCRMMCVFLVAGCALASSTACGTSPTGAGAAGGAGSCPRNGTVPPNIRDVERAGEGLVATTFGDYPMRSANWSRASTVLGILKDVWGKGKAECPGLPAAQTKAVDDAIKSLDASVRAQDQKGAVTAANAVGLACPELFDYFKPEAPIQIIRMDAVYRQIGIDAHQGNWAGVVADVDSLAADLDASRGAIAAKVPTCHRVGGTQTVLADIDQSIANLKISGPAKDQTTSEIESDNGALQIDTLELLFDCPPDGAPPSTGLGSHCTATTQCGTNEVCDTTNAGGTCAPDPATAKIGTACSTTLDCGNDGRSACLTAAGDNYPGGYCAMEPCNDVQVCPPGATCISQPHETPGCYLSCTTDAQCRTGEGYVCQLYPTAPPGGFGPTDHACGFPCKDDGGCTTPLKCNVANGKCNP